MTHGPNLFERPPTARQIEIARLVEECKGNCAEAARRLGVRHNSVKAAYRTYRIKTNPHLREQLK